MSSDQVPHLTKECLVALRCGRECADLKLALRQEFCNLEEVLNGAPSWTDAVGEVIQVPTLVTRTPSVFTDFDKFSR